MAGLSCRDPIYEMASLSEIAPKKRIGSSVATFNTIYWAYVSLMTERYGEIYSVSDLGRVVTMLSSLIGVALIALRAGILTGGYMDEMRKETERAKSQ